jgi:hypothetical protein
MKIECILQRKGGTVVELPGKTYHFTPQKDGKHVAEVTIEAHIERFLSIPEAYRLLRTLGAEAAVATFAPATDAPIIDPDNVMLLGSSVHPATFDINGKTYALGDIVQRAFADSGLTAENWNDLPEDTRATKIDIVLDGIEDGEITIDAAHEGQPVTNERAELVEQYKAKFGKRPPNTFSVETIKVKLAEAGE